MNSHPVKLKADISEEQSSTRELHLKDLRDRIVRTKRAGREAEALRAGSIALAGQPFNTRGDIVEGASILTKACSCARSQSRALQKSFRSLF